MTAYTYSIFVNEHPGYTHIPVGEETTTRFPSMYGNANIDFDITVVLLDPNLEIIDTVVLKKPEFLRTSKLSITTHKFYSYDPYINPFPKESFHWEYFVIEDSDEDVIRGETRKSKSIEVEREDDLVIPDDIRKPAIQEWKPPLTTIIEESYEILVYYVDKTDPISWVYSSFVAYYQQTFYWYWEPSMEFFLEQAVKKSSY